MIREALRKRGQDLPAAVIAVEGQGKVPGSNIHAAKLHVAVVGEPDYTSAVSEMLRTGINHARNVENEALGFSREDAVKIFETKTD